MEVLLKTLFMPMIHNENNVITKSFYEDLVGQTMTEEELLSYYDEKLLELLNRLYQNA